MFLDSLRKELRTELRRLSSSRTVEL